MIRDEPSIIKNKNDLFLNHDLEAVRVSFNGLEYAFKNCDPGILVRKAIHFNSFFNITDIFNKSVKYSIPKKNSILVISVGKASEKMLGSFMDALGDKIFKCILITPHQTSLPDDSIYSNKITIIRSSHPIPNHNSVKAAKTIIKELQLVDRSKLVVFLISGGASSLLVKPVEGLNLNDKKQINKLLISSGADIREINAVRKHLSDIKGGKILRFIDSQVTVLSLILSDVIGDHLDTIGSGLTAVDNSTFSDAKSILQKYLKSITELPTQKANNVLQLGIDGKIPETMKKDSYYHNINNMLIGNNAYFCQSISQYMHNLGYNVTYLGSECNMLIHEFVKFSQMIIKKHLKPKSCILIGGELVNVLPKNKSIGKGGRNQEAICSLLDLFNNYDSQDYAIICIGTDGIDGNSFAAGGLLTPITIATLNKEKINKKIYLERHDSNTLLSRLHSNIITNYTGTNFNDVYMFTRSR